MKKSVSKLSQHFRCSNKSNFFINFWKNFFTCIKMSQCSSAKYYHDNYKKSCWKISKFFCRRERKKGNDMVMIYTQIYQKIKEKNWLSVEKSITKREKTPYYNYKKLISFRKLFLSVWVREMCGQVQVNLLGICLFCPWL